MEIKKILENLEREKINSFMEIVENEEKTPEMFDKWCDENLNESIDQMKITLKKYFFESEDNIEETVDLFTMYKSMINNAREYIKIATKKIKIEKDPMMKKTYEKEIDFALDEIDFINRKMRKLNLSKESIEYDEENIDEMFAGKFKNIIPLSPKQFKEFVTKNKKIKCSIDNDYEHCYINKDHVATYCTKKNILYTNMDTKDLLENINKIETNDFENKQEEKTMNRNQILGTADALRDFENKNVKESFEDMSEDYVTSYKEELQKLEEEEKARLEEDRKNLSVADLFDVINEMKKELTEIKEMKKVVEETEEKNISEEMDHDYMVGYTHGYEDFMNGIMEMNVSDRDESDYAIAYRDGWNTSISDKSEEDEEDEEYGIEPTYGNGYAEGFDDAYYAKDVAKISESEELSEFKKGYDKGLEEGLEKLNADKDNFEKLIGEEKAKEVYEKLVAERESEEDFVSYMNEIKDLGESDEDKATIINFLVDENNRLNEDEEMMIEVCESVDELVEDEDLEEALKFEGKKSIDDLKKLVAKVKNAKITVENNGKVSIEIDGKTKTVFKDDIIDVKNGKIEIKKPSYVESEEINVTSIIEESKNELNFETSKERLDELVEALEVESEEDLKTQLKDIVEALKEEELKENNDDDENTSTLTEKEQQLLKMGFILK